MHLQTSKILISILVVFGTLTCLILQLLFLFTGIYNMNYRSVNTDWDLQRLKPRSLLTSLLTYINFGKNKTPVNDTKVSKKICNTKNVKSKHLQYKTIIIQYQNTQWNHLQYRKTWNNLWKKYTCIYIIIIIIYYIIYMKYEKNRNYLFSVVFFVCLFVCSIS